MTKLTPEQRALVEEGLKVQAAFDAAEQHVNDLRTQRVEQMKALHEAGVPWAQIGRTFAVTPQAAMYATGHAKRQPKRPPKKAQDTTPS